MTFIIFRIVVAGVDAYLQEVHRGMISLVALELSDGGFNVAIAIFESLVAKNREESLLRLLL